MKKLRLRLDPDLLRVQSFTASGIQPADLMTGGQSPGRCCDWQAVRQSGETECCPEVQGYAQDTDYCSKGACSGETCGRGCTV